MSKSFKTLTPLEGNEAGHAEDGEGDHSNNDVGGGVVVVAAVDYRVGAKNNLSVMSKHVYSLFVCDHQSMCSQNNLRTLL
jgi:hypothetical protein